ncbi:LysR family transcriptional regulator [Rhodovulum sp. DZ06]|uniref:LysR family transcriptional regulator n=1 Tax=Rhodovulum sp. DZ06 TaxID=3425126 RepID=UPI003D348701
MRREDLADLSALVTAAEERSFTKAARRLGVSQSALSRIVRRLEDRLGVRLLARTTRSVAPTEAGARLVARVAPMLRDIGESLEEPGELSERPSGLIRITAVEHAARTVLTPVVSAFVEEHPEVTVEVAVDYGLTDIVAERFDAALRRRADG